MKRRLWISGALIGLAAGLVVAGVMTYLDWRLNPGGIFHGTAGTNWPVLLETVWTWFLPVGPLEAALSTAVLFGLRRRSRSRGARRR